MIHSILRRQGFGSYEFNTMLPNGDHLSLRHQRHDRWYAERTRTVVVDRLVHHSKHCGCRLCESGGPTHREVWSITQLVCSEQGTSAAGVLARVAPYVDFGVREDGTFPVLAYMPYSDSDIRAYPHIATDIPEALIPDGAHHT